MNKILRSIAAFALVGLVLLGSSDASAASRAIYRVSKYHAVLNFTFTLMNIGSGGLVSFEESKSNTLTIQEDLKGLDALLANFLKSVVYTYDSR